LRWKSDRTSFAAAAALAGLAIAGLAAAAPPPMTANTGAKLRVLKPSRSAVVTDNTVQTAVSITHFKVDCDFAGTANRKGIGHYHIELDHSLINMFCSNRAPISMLNVAPGKHTLTFIPAANDHADDLKAEKKVSFSYEPSSPLPVAKRLRFPGEPSITIVSPKNDATVNGAFDLSVRVRNLRLSCALYGKADLGGYGHWHANVDSTTQGMMGMGTMLGMSCGKTFRVSLAGIKPGKHRFFAILENNKHAPAFGVQASVSVNVR
jgi:hypothetical protein